MRDLLRSGGLGQPDEVSYEFDPDEVILVWREPKLAVVVELDEEADVETDAERLAERCRPDLTPESLRRPQ